MAKGAYIGVPLQPLASVAVGSTVKLKENGVPVDYLVVHQGNPDASIYDASCDGVWLLRKDLYGKRAWSTDGTFNSYADGNIHPYLNGEFLGIYDTLLQTAIKQVKIPYRAHGGPQQTITGGSSGLSARIFLLSSTEVCFSNAYMPPNEGAVLDYFAGCNQTSADSKRVGYLNGAATGWWLRSPYTSSSSNSFASAVFASGTCGNNTITNEYGLRPAMIVPYDMAVFADGLISGAAVSSANGVARKIKKGYVGVDGVARKIKKAYIGIGGNVTYREVEYIQSSGTQYIDTGFVPNQDTRVVMDCEVTNFPENWAALFSTRSDSETTNAFAFYYKDAGNVYDQYGSQNVNLANQTVTGRRIVDKNKNIATVDGTVINTFAYTAFTAQCSLCLFMDRMPTKAAKYFFSGKTYSCRIYDNGTLVRDYVPVINPNGTPGMFDKITKQFHANKGTGNFAAGAETGATHVSSGVARPCWAGGELVYYGTITPLSYARYSLAAASNGSYAMFGGGRPDSAAVGSGYVDAYDSTLTRKSPSTSFGGATQSHAAANVGTYVLFGGGRRSNSYPSTVYAYDRALTYSSPTDLNAGAAFLAATNVGNYAIFGGGQNTSGSGWTVSTTAYNSSLTKSTPTSLSAGRSELTATSSHGFALFAGGVNNGSLSSVVDAYNESLTRSTITALSVARYSLASASNGKYALFGGGWRKLSNGNGSAADTVDAYDASLTRISVAPLSVANDFLSATNVTEFALFGGGGEGDSKSVDAYNSNLTKTTFQISAGFTQGAAANIGNFALFGGGVNSSVTGTVHAFTVA